eukprot:2828265-Pleurochrysis_carterae.AAC.1
MRSFIFSSSVLAKIGEERVDWAECEMSVARAGERAILGRDVRDTAAMDAGASKAAAAAAVSSRSFVQIGMAQGNGTHASRPRTSVSYK